ncbi:glycine oxidase ThiO [Actinomadura livida]|uniref:glycine oxidase n=1 Tax=Actinomadura livida TaxID=79909 RepID=A0A7W7MZ02_9ACTN|nr:MULTISPECIES: glycine oxidase ThiO [Actinomadura]MBB4776466.1 glycine oxidase [Actinomadura catellatispora]GGT92513.1 glycine oxidase ThiO [Actinomadura livida]
MEIVIIGAGVVGLATGWRAAAAGAAVTLVDPDPGGGASSVAAGMLTPVSEVTYGEEPLLRLGLASRDRYGAFVAELEELTGLETAYRTDGILQVAFDSDDLTYLDDLRRFQESLGIAAEALTGRECRKAEPMLAPGVRGGLLAPEDGSIDPRRLTAALLTAAEKAGARLVRRRAAGVAVENDAAAGVRLDDGTVVRADRVLLAAGPWSGDLAGLPPGAVPPVRPVKGQVMRLRTRVPFLTRATRGLVKGSSVYLVPRADGEIVLGATQEELGFDTRVTAGGLWELLRDARELLPGITELEFAEVSAGLRPGSPDNAPVMGPSALPGLFVGTGHFRNGVLLTPVSADILSAMLLDGPVPDVAGHFSPDRFSAEVHSR